MSDARNCLMTHLVAHYPDQEKALAVARGMIDGGARYLEIQLPFSDPSADGPVIQEACASALKNGYKLEAGFDLIRQVRTISDIPIFVMSYANVPFCYGLKDFVARCKREAVNGLIIPDLLPGRDEGLHQLALDAGMPLLPVIVPTISQTRIEEILALNPQYLYIAMRAGITGKETEIDKSLLAFLDIFTRENIKVLAGFGVRTQSQVRLLASHVHGIVVGSALVTVIQENLDADANALYNAIMKRVADLVG